jgi:hypothetical protein
MATSLVGPAPGHVGGCNTGAGLANAEDYCRQKEYRICVRNRSRGVLTDDAMLTMCIDGIGGLCSGNNWPAGCAPTQMAANACLDALLRMDLLPLDHTAIPECMLCGGAGGGVDPEGI